MHQVSIELMNFSGTRARLNAYLGRVLRMRATTICFDPALWTRVLVVEFADCGRAV